MYGILEIWKRTPDMGFLNLANGLNGGFVLVIVEGAQQILSIAHYWVWLIDGGKGFIGASLSLANTLWGGDSEKYIVCSSLRRHD